MMVIRKLNRNDRPQFDGLIDIIESSITNSDLWMPIKEEAGSHFFDPSWTLLYGCFEDDRLIGSSALFLNEFEYGESVLAIGDCYPPIGEIGRCMVVPEHRNKGLMLKMNKQLVKEAKKMGLKTLVATAHPENYASNKTLENLGMHVVRCIRKEGKYLRNVLRLYL